MKFTATPPTKPGFYAYRFKPSDTPAAIHIVYPGGLQFWPPNCQWCRLVPAEEVEMAFKEGALSFKQHEAHIEHHWIHSRAKKVMEGEV